MEVGGGEGGLFFPREKNFFKNKTHRFTNRFLPPNRGLNSFRLYAIGMVYFGGALSLFYFLSEIFQWGFIFLNFFGGPWGLFGGFNLFSPGKINGNYLLTYLFF